MIRRQKYNATKTEIDGITFDSKGEARRYAELRLMERGGLISGLERQPEFVLQEAFTDCTGQKHRAIKYRADFKYIENGRIIIEDFKGMLTQEFKLKAKLFRFMFPDVTLRITK
jgi:hypothetical protein